MPRLFEINGNLSGDDGIINYDLFQSTIMSVKAVFCAFMGEDSLNKIPIYVDNATKDSGHTPIITPILGRVLIIKLGINENSKRSQIILQFAHELTHAVFFNYYGIDKPRAIPREESICTAASLITVRMLCPEDFELQLDYVNNLKNIAYKNGIGIANDCSYDLNEIKTLIANFDKYKYSTNSQ